MQLNHVIIYALSHIFLSITLHVISWHVCVSLQFVFSYVNFYISNFIQLSFKFEYFL